MGIQKIHLPEALTHINKHVFLASGLVTLNIPQGIDEIDKGAFQNCSNLVEVVLPKMSTIKDTYSWTNGR